MVHYDPMSVTRNWREAAVATPLLTIQDLMKRWRLSEKQVRDLVFRAGLPMIQLTATSKNVNWRTARFRLSAVERWEQDRERVWREEPQGPPPKTLRAGSREVPNYLGFRPSSS